VKDEKAISKLRANLGSLREKIIDLKNKGRNNTRSQMITGAMGWSRRYRDEHARVRREI
jgi:hypothetical protein